MMRVGWFAVLTTTLLLPLACGESFSSNGGEPITGPSDSLKQACERYCSVKVGCSAIGNDEPECVKNCRARLADSGPCTVRATEMVDCYRERSDATDCTLPDVCMPETALYARCRGFGCATLSCGESMPLGLECSCVGSCGSGWVVAAACNPNMDGTKFNCSCRLTGPLAPYFSNDTVTADCVGPPECIDEDWSCCRQLLLPAAGSTP